MSLTDDARSAGQGVFRALRVSIAEKAASLLATRPELAGTAVEVGLVDREWLEAPGQHRISSAAPLDVVVRFLERSVERQPSFLASMGLNAIQLLSWRSEEGLPVDGASTQPVSVVFTDLEGFTRFTARNGDDAATAMLGEHHRAVNPLVRGRGGRVVKRLGDGLMLSFPEPAAAVLAALELLDTAPEPLRLRAGVHYGEAVVTRDDLIGHVVNVAARVAEAASGGQVLVTAEAAAAAGDVRGVTFGRARRRTFKGVGESVSVCAATPG